MAPVHWTEEEVSKAVNVTKACSLFALAYKLCHRLPSFQANSNHPAQQAQEGMVACSRPAAIPQSGRTFATDRQAGFNGMQIRGPELCQAPHPFLNIFHYM
eukprot:1158883-Pelagomonas_calceolata.AAC.25